MTTSKKHDNSLSPLLYFLRHKVMPLVQERGMSCIAVALPTHQQMLQRHADWPDGITLTPKPLRGRRVAVSQRRQRTGNAQLIDAHWPADRLHSSTTPGLLFPVTGQVAVPFGDYMMHCKPGHGVLMPPGTPYSDGSHLALDESQPNGVCEMLSFKSWGNGVECWLNHTSGGRHWSHQDIGENCHIMHPQSSLYLEVLSQEASTRGPHSQLICDGLMRVFIALMLREIEAARAFQPLRLTQTSLDPSAPALLSTQTPIERAQNYVRDHLAEPISINAVARYTHMSRAHFTRQFRQATGQTLIEYVTQCRLEKARILLKDTQWPIEKISGMVGITPAQLRVLFQRHLKTTPGHFRLQSRQEK